MSGFIKMKECNHKFCVDSYCAGCGKSISEIMQWQHREIERLKDNKEIIIEEMIEQAKEIEGRLTQIEEEADQAKAELTSLYNKLRKLNKQ